MNSFTVDQQLVFDKYVAGENVFASGAGGVGKSFLIKHIFKHAKDNNKNIKVTALTGCAAILLQCNALTLHAFAGFGLALDTSDIIIAQLFDKPYKLKHWKNLHILIVDEVSMMSLKIFKIIDIIARKYFKKPDIPFGGLQVLFTGDFFQLLPVNTDCNDREASMFCFQDPLWDAVFPKQNQIILNTIFRQQDEGFLKVLKYVRQGRITHSTKALLESRVFSSEVLHDIQKTDRKSVV